MNNNRKDIISLFRFLSKVEKLKNTLRTSRTSNGRQESTAEHSWMLSLLALLVTKEYPDLDHVKILSLCIVHDIAESITGDLPAPENHNKSKKEKNELIAINQLVKCLPDALAFEISSLWSEYTKCNTAEARLVKALDKIETIFQHNIGINPSDFDYSFNLTYGENITSLDKFTKEIRKKLNEDTKEKIKHLKNSSNNQTL
ncbi:TPA: HD domain-containing protein [Serratia marcescens]